MERKTDLFVVKVPSGGGPVVTRRKGKDSRIAMLSASLLTLGAISCASLGLWRLGTDLDWAGDFVVQSGFLSHWQVWIGTAVVVQYASCWLTRYVRSARRREVKVVPAAALRAVTR